VRERFRRIYDTCQPYLVASEFGTPAATEELAFGLELTPELRFDPLKVRSGTFLHTLQRLDELTFGPVGMTMPRWVFYDCAEVPGGIFGFARPASEVPEWVLRALGLEQTYTGPVPISMYVAIPMLAPGCWNTYTLCSLNQVAPGSAPAGISLFTEGVALQTFGIDTAYGATQWRSPKLSVHSRFGPLDLVTAWTPAHSDPSTLTFRVSMSRERIEHALVSNDPPLADDDPELRWIDCDQHDELRALQAEIEAGKRFQIVGGPSISGAYTRVPIREVTA